MFRLKIAAFNPAEELLKQFGQYIEKITVEKQSTPTVYDIKTTPGVNVNGVIQYIRENRIIYRAKPSVEIIESDELYAEHPENDGSGPPDWLVKACTERKIDKESLPKYLEEGYTAEKLAELLQRRLNYLTTGYIELVEITDESDGLSGDNEDKEEAEAFVKELNEITEAQRQANAAAITEDIMEVDEESMP